MPATKMMAATMPAQVARKVRRVRTSHAPARPPSTASGGNTNTKCRMPLYIAGRNATVTATGNSAASAISRKTARRLTRCRMRTAASIAPAAPPNPSTEKITRQLEREQRRHVSARHVRNGNQSAVEQLLPRLLEEVGEVLDGAKRVERLDHGPRPDQRHDDVGQQHAGERAPGRNVRAARQPAAMPLARDSTANDQGDGSSAFNQAEARP